MLQVQFNARVFCSKFPSFFPLFRFCSWGTSWREASPSTTAASCRSWRRSLRCFSHEDWSRSVPFPDRFSGPTWARGWLSSACRCCSPRKRLRWGWTCPPGRWCSTASGSTTAPASGTCCQVWRPLLFIAVCFFSSMCFRWFHSCTLRWIYPDGWQSGTKRSGRHRHCDHPV